MKTCSKCLKNLEIDNFYKDSKNSSGYRSDCKACTKLYKKNYFSKTKEKQLDKLKKWKKDNPDKVKSGNLRNFYGITLEKYQEMATSQHNCCAICGKHESNNIKDGRNNKIRSLSVDHNHSTGRIRGLLCYHCNIAVGMLKDSITNAMKLVEYLSKNEKE